MGWRLRAVCQDEQAESLPQRQENTEQFPQMYCLQNSVASYTLKKPGP